MKILLNALPLTEIATGVQRYVRSLYGEMESLPDVSVLYCTKFGAGSQMPWAASVGPSAKRIGMIRKFPAPMIVGARLLARLLFERQLRQVKRNIPCDLCHEPAFFSPVLHKIPVVTTVHDLSIIKHPEKHPPDSVRFFDILFRRRLPHAAHIITVSDFTRQEVMDEFRVIPHKVTTVHLAHDTIFHPRSGHEIRSMLELHGWPREYILFVGTLEPRKNLRLL
ncbi:MAG: glycosyltransferase, partial [Syntrophobacteraceae bacterium]